MDGIIQHKNLFDRWCKMSIADQMGNIGSEVSRSLKNQDKPERFTGAFDRALELFDFTIEALQRNREFAKLQEVCRAREEFCDYFNGNSMGTDPVKMQKYYDEFVIMARSNI